MEDNNGMGKLRIEAIPDDKVAKVTTELTAPVHRDPIAYAETLARQTGQPVDPAKLIPLMLARFMATDRGFKKLRRQSHSANAPADDKGG
jgi:hypothetical protein